MPDLLLPPGVRYACIRCGACCRTLEVTLTDAEHERLAGHDWSGELPDYAPDRYFARRRGVRGKQTWRLRSQPSGACRFLTDDGLCRVHSVLGYKAKPFAGRLFPFTFTVTPIGVFVGVRFSCPAVVRGKGPELEKQRHDIQRLYKEYARAYGPPMAPERVRFHRGLELSWHDVVRLEDQLLAFLLAQHLPVARRLLACRRLVHRFLKEASGSADGERVGVEPDEILAEAAVAQPEGNGLSRIEGALLRLLTAAFVGVAPPSFRELSMGGRLRVRLGNVGRRLRMAFGRGRVVLPELPEAVPVSDATAADGGELDMPTEAMLERYYVAKVASQGFFGQSFFGRSFVEGIDFLASSYGAILWLARAHAVAAGRRRVAADDVEYAIRQVDHGFGYSPAFAGGLDHARAFFFRAWATQDRILMRDA